MGPATADFTPVRRSQILRDVRAGEQQVFQYVSLYRRQHAPGAVSAGPQAVRKLGLRVSEHEPGAQPFAPGRRVARTEHGRS